MELTRRACVAFSGALLSGALAGCSAKNSSNETESPTERSTDTPIDTPTEVREPLPDITEPEVPREESSEYVVKEAYGELVLTSEKPVWTFEVPEGDSDCTKLEYEVDILDGDSRSFDIFGLIDKGAYNSRYDFWRENLREEIRGRSAEFSEDLNADLSTEVTDGSDRVSHKNPSGWGSEHVELLAFDAADHLSEHEYIRVRVAIRVVDFVPGDVQQGVDDNLKATFAEMGVDAADGLANSICTTFDVGDISMPAEDEEIYAPEHDGAIIDTVVQILDRVELYSELSLGPITESFDRVESWARFGSSFVPIVGSVLEVHSAACELDDGEATVEERELFLSRIGILVVEVLLSVFGVVGKASLKATRAIDRHFAWIKEFTGLRTYLVLLREVYLVIYEGFHEVLEQIKDYVENTEILNLSERGRIMSLEPTDLQNMASWSIELQCD